MDRKLATIERITDVSPIPGADAIEVASVKGWKSVVRKGEFFPNSLCVFAEVDSLLPSADWSAFLRDKKNPAKPIRLRTMTLKGQISQGVCFPLSILPPEKQINPIEGENVAECLGITKYEAPIPAELAGEAKGSFPAFIPKTDTQRVQSYPSVLDELQGKYVYVGQKVDGTSSTFYMRNGEFGVCGRNWELKPSETNTLWRVANRYAIADALKRSGANLAIQAECYGEGIQKNPLQIKGQDIAVFDIYDIDNGCYLDYDSLVAVANNLKLPTVKYLYVGPMKWTSVAELLEYADGLDYDSGKPAEGVVIRPTTEQISQVMNERLAIKAISNRFLKRGGE